MKCMILLLVLLFACTSCSALPAEERAFAVALLVEKPDGLWRVHARIPTYQTGGGYVTITGEGGSFSAALNAMNNAVPMQLHLSQLRLLVLEESIGRSKDLQSVLTTLGTRADMRLQCTAAITRSPVAAVAQALQPAVGARLSKALDVLLDSRAEQGTILPVTLADVLRMGERQSAVLPALTLTESGPDLSGGYPISAEGRQVGPITAEECAMLSLLLGHGQHLTLSVLNETVSLREADAAWAISPDRASVQVKLCVRATMSSLPIATLEQQLAADCLVLITRLYGQGCDVLGLARQVIPQAEDLTQWQALHWAEHLSGLRWTVSVSVHGPA